MTPRQSPYSPAFLGPRSAGLQRTQGGKCSGRLLCLIVFVGLAVVTLLAPPEVLAQTVDPQSLVGQWAGTWARVSERILQGQVSMTVTTDEGNQVHGRFERDGDGKAVASVRFDIVGILEGAAHLVFSGSGNSVDLTISGPQMQGMGLESFRLNYSMTKNK